MNGFNNDELMKTSQSMHVITTLWLHSYNKCQLVNEVNMNYNNTCSHLHTTPGTGGPKNSSLIAFTHEEASLKVFTAIKYCCLAVTILNTYFPLMALVDVMETLNALSRGMSSEASPGLE